MLYRHPAKDMRGDGDLMDYCVDDPVSCVDPTGLAFTAAASQAGGESHKGISHPFGAKHSESGNNEKQKSKATSGVDGIHIKNSPSRYDASTLPENDEAFFRGIRPLEMTFGDIIFKRNKLFSHSQIFSGDGKENFGLFPSNEVSADSEENIKKYVYDSTPWNKELVKEAMDYLDTEWYNTEELADEVKNWPTFSGDFAGKDELERWRLANSNCKSYLNEIEKYVRKIAEERGISPYSNIKK